jgi:anthranilate synthase component 1
VSQKPSYVHEIFPGRYDLATLLENNSEYFPFLLQSTALVKKSQKGFDILFALPQQQLIKHFDNTVSLDGADSSESGFLGALDKEWKKNDIEKPDDLPFCGGWFVYLGYELAAEIEPSIEFCDSENNELIAFAVRIPAAVIYDHANDQTHMVIENEFASDAVKIKTALMNVKYEPVVEKKSLIDNLEEEDARRYENSVLKILDYIRDGDVFQVNLSRQWQARLNQGVSDVDVYRQLRHANPAPYSAIVKYGGETIVSSSPERLFCTGQGLIQTRPIAGTRPRGDTSSYDAKLQDELISNYKERAEHIMLIDLERNDLGRICQPGTISVDEFMAIESYAHVHHIVSNITGKLLTDITPGNIIRAVFPGGTITGCPKVRCMEIISELEQTARGPYTGSLGYLNHNGDMDMNILIRSLKIRDRQVTFRAGAGIVSDSSPEKELNETRAKAKGIINALQGYSR